MNAVLNRCAPTMRPFLFGVFGLATLVALSAVAYGVCYPIGYCFELLVHRFDIRALGVAGNENLALLGCMLVFALAASLAVVALVAVIVWKWLVIFGELTADSLASAHAARIQRTRT